MVTARIRRFTRLESGIALTEGLIVFPLMLLAIIVLIELGYMVTQWNFAAKGMQLAARKLVVSAPVVDPVAFNATFNPAAQAGGTVTPINGQSMTCTGYQCNRDMMDYLVEGGTAPSTWPGLRNYFLTSPKLTPQDVTVTYTQTGLGYFGRPSGPVVTVRLNVSRATESPLPFLGALLNMSGFTLPPMTVTVTSEDLCSGNDRENCG